MFRRFLARINLFQLYPIFVLIILPLIVFYKATLGTDLFALGDFSGSDLLEMHLPSKYILHDAYTHGEFPLWTPYLSNGFPILAEGQSGPLYLPHILFAYLPPFLALNYSILLPIIIAGLGAYIFARRLPRMSLFGAFCCGIVFMLCSFFIARLKHLNMIAVAAYLPWCLWIISKSLERSDGRAFQIKLLWFVLLGCVWALQIYAGHPHMFYFCVIMTMWFAIGEIIRLRVFYNPSNVWGIIISLITGFFVSGLMGVGLAAAQLLPTIELTQLSSRLQYTFETATSFPLRPSFLATLFAPFFLGNPATGGYKGNISIDGIWWENVLYIGLLPFILFVMTLIFRLKRLLGVLLFNTSSKLRYRLKLYLSEELYYYWFFVFSAILFFLLSCGDYTGLFSFVYYNVPGMQLFRFPTRFNLFTLLSLAVVTGYSLDRAIARLETSRLNAIVKRTDSSDYVFSWPFSVNLTQFLITLVIIVDLVVFAYQYVGFFPVGKYLATPASVTDLRKDTSDYRIYPITQYSQNPFKELGWKNGAEAIYSLQTAIPGNFAAVYKLASFTDRGWFEGGLGVAARHRLEKSLLDNSIPPEVLSKVLGMWNVKYLIGFNEVNSTLSSYASYTLEKSFGLPLNILENKSVLPRAYFTSKLKRVASEDVVFESLFSDTFIPEYEALTNQPISEQNTVTVASDDFQPEAFRQNNSATIVRSSALRTVIQAKTENGGYLVLTDTYYPGWKAHIDGKNSPIYHVNLVQRAVYVDKGSHTIVWSYEPVMFYIGVCISFATFVCCICIGIFALRKKGSAGGGIALKK